VAERNQLLRIDEESFQAFFDRRPFVLQTELAHHPLLSVERLVALARTLPPELVEYNAGDLPVGADPSGNPRNGLSPEETLRRIETCRSWLVLKRVEREPELGALLDACLDELEPSLRRQVAHTFDRQAFVFVSSPGAVTPFHMDPEHNFLIQIRGTKTLHVWDPEDRFVVREEDLETFHSAFVQRNLPFQERFQYTAHRIELCPGQAVHVPVTAPHWVQNGPQVSISLSLTFRSDRSQGRELVYRTNAQLRRLGLSPTPVGRRPLLDAAKRAGANAFLIAREAARFLKER
jgi:quercetin dioxygenase-like cupin family protein